MIPWRIVLVFIRKYANIMFLKYSNFLRTLFDGQYWDNHKYRESGNRISIVQKLCV